MVQQTNDDFSNQKYQNLPDSLGPVSDKGEQHSKTSSCVTCCIRTTTIRIIYFIVHFFKINFKASTEESTSLTDSGILSNGLESFIHSKNTFSYASSIMKSS